jgi:hypothetical protein
MEVSWLAKVTHGPVKKERVPKGADSLGTALPWPGPRGGCPKLRFLSSPAGQGRTCPALGGLAGKGGTPSSARRDPDPVPGPRVGWGGVGTGGGAPAQFPAATTRKARREGK